MTINVRMTITTTTAHWPRPGWADLTRPVQQGGHEAFTHDATVTVGEAIAYAYQVVQMTADGETMRVQRHPVRFTLDVPGSTVVGGRCVTLAEARHFAAHNQRPGGMIRSGRGRHTPLDDLRAAVVELLARIDRHGDLVSGHHGQ